MQDIAALKAQIDFSSLVAETHVVNPAGKTLCPFHDDRHPSCHIYKDGFKCFACGAYGDALDWLERVLYADQSGGHPKVDAANRGEPPRPA